jgi:hypothetical protein
VCCWWLVDCYNETSNQLTVRAVRELMMFPAVASMLVYRDRRDTMPAGAHSGGTTRPGAIDCDAPMRRRGAATKSRD